MTIRFKRPILEYSRFEDRQLLAADLPTSQLLQVPNSLPAQTNLVSNGDFETFDSSGGLTVEGDTATANFLPNGQVTGWSASDGDGDGNQRINLLAFSNERGTILDLDSIPGQDDRVFQDIGTVVGQQYVLSLDFRNQPPLSDSVSADTNDFEVYWNDELVGTFTGGSFWQTAALRVTGASNGGGSEVAGSDVVSRLEFRDMRTDSINREGDGRGALIDCVSLVKVADLSVENSGFENGRVDAGELEEVPGTAVDPLVNVDEVPGWSVFASEASDRVMRIGRNATGETSRGGDFYLTLNSSSDRLDQVFQELVTTPNATYFLTFDLRHDPNNSGAHDPLRVRWNDAWAATIAGSDDWQSYGVLLDGNANAETSLLVFREAGENLGTGASAQIDNVRLLLVEQPLSDLAVDANGSDSGTNATVTFTENAGAITIAPALEVSHPSGDQLTFAVVTLLGETPASSEILEVVVGNSGLVPEYDATTGQLELRGAASLATYQAVLRTVTYNNTAENLVDGQRQIGISITDNAIDQGDNFSQRALVDVTLVGVNDTPSVASIENASLDFGEPLLVDVAASDNDGDTVTYAVSAAGLAADKTQPTISDSGQISWVSSVGGEFDLTVTATDPSGAANSQTFTVTVADFIPFAGTRSLTNVDPLQRNDIYSAAPPFNIDLSNDYVAVINTNRGEIRVQLLDNVSPTFVNNFVNLARDGFYDGLVFHRVIESFVAQGGDPQGSSTSTVPGEGPGQGGPGYQIPDEAGNNLPFDSRGQLAYANSGNNTTGSQFFITLAQTNLSSSQFSVFGNVISGDSVLNLLTRTQVGNNTPIPGAVADVINSITIEETSSVT